MRPIVVDASVAVKWFVPEVGSEQAEALARTGRTLLAPALIRLEVASAFSKKARRGLVTLEHAREYTEVLPSYFDKLLDATELLDAALALSVELDHPIFDCVYLDMARRYHAEFVTADARLVKKLEGHAISQLTVALGEWTSLA